MTLSENSLRLESQGTPRKNNYSWSRFMRKATPFLFLSPFLIGFLVFMVYPLIYAFNLSLYRKQIIGGVTFIGLSNYVKSFQDPSFWEGIRNVLVFGIIQIPIMLGLALLFATLIDSGVVHRVSIFRLGYFLPFAVPNVVAALIWGYFYGQSFGPITQLANALHLQPPVFLNAQGIIPSIANISVWQYTGYNMLIIYAAMKAIPTELYEAAKVDGASEWQIAWNIRIPLVMPAILLTFIFSIIGTLQLFNEPSVLNTVAPTAMDRHFTPNLYVYNLAFANKQFDYSAAISFTLAIVTAAVSSIVLFVIFRREANQ
ncbi:MAG TPA: sugar ABC transporter permease [Anaerolineales bacterium]|nr:sugar ABC transporter permease [Anaerolineales bacterium]